jgi:2-hydroxy-3-oxopropionate reductase
MGITDESRVTSTTDSQPRADVAVVGLGAIGLPVCRNLVRGRLLVQAWNRSQTSAASAAKAGAHIVGNVGDVDASVVVVALPDMPQINEVLTSGLREALRPGDILVVLSTVAPTAVRELSEELSTRGVGVVDAPVSGGDVGAEQATLVLMVGAAEADFARCESLFGLIGKTAVHLGPVGTGSVAKMANQIVVGATLAAIGEALSVTRASGLDDHAVLDVLCSGLADSQALRVKRAKLESGDFKPGGSADNQLKDLEHALSTADALGLRLEVARSARAIYRRLVDRGLGRLDHSAAVLAAAPPTHSEEDPA